MTKCVASAASRLARANTDACCREFTFVSREPALVRAPTTILHPELRDLLQPTGRKRGELLCIHESRLCLIDFDNPKVKTMLSCI